MSDITIDVTPVQNNITVTITGAVVSGGGGGAGSDTTAIHDDTANEISAITEKTSPVSGDLFIIEDSAASNVKKRLTYGNLIPDSTETVKGKVELATAAETLTGTDNTRAVHPAGLKASAWYLSGTSTLAGAAVVVGTASNTLKYQFDALGTTQTDGAGLWMANTTAAAAGAQQISPSVTLEGQGWRTNATAESQSVKFTQYVVPVQGAANPSGRLTFASSINNGAYGSAVSISSAGEITALNGSTGGFAIWNGSVTLISIRASTGSAMNFTVSAGYTYEFGGGKSLNITQTAQSSGWAPAVTVTCGAHTGMTASTEFSDFVFAGNRTVQWATGALTTQRFTWFKGATLSFVGASTVTDAYNVYIDDLTAGANATLTRKHAVGIVGSASFIISGNAGSAPTNGFSIHAKDSSDGSANATVALYTEQAAEATATFTQTHRLKIWHNGVEYYLPLDSV